MANWFEVRAGTVTEAEARAYFRRPTLSEAIQPGETGAMRLRLSCLIRWPSPAAFKTPSRAGDKPHVPSEPRSLIWERLGRQHTYQGHGEASGEKRCFQVAFGTPM